METQAQALAGQAQLLEATRKRLVLLIDKFIVVLEKRKNKAKTKPAVAAEIYKVVSNGDVEPLLAVDDVAELGDAIVTSGDPGLLEMKTEIEEAIQQHIVFWPQLAKKHYLMKILRQMLGDSPDRVRGGSGNQSSGNQLKVNSISDIYKIMSHYFNATVAESLEVVLSAALTLKSVDRARGVSEPRPLWVLLVGAPSSFKSTLLKMIGESRYTLLVDDITPAGLVPAKGDVPPLVRAMDGRVTILPTLSLIASQRKEEARRLFAFLEAIYDGRIARKTGMGEYMQFYVDTVVLGAITNDVYRVFSDVFLSYGSRWLIWYVDISREEALEIAEKLVHEKPVGLSSAISEFFDRAAEGLAPEDFAKPYMDNETRRDLRTLASLLASMRVVVRKERSFDEESGRWIEEVVVTQADVPTRAYMQLLRFVQANTILRKKREMEIVGLPMVDAHAMRLAAKLALSSTTPEYTRIIQALLESNGVLEGLRELSRRAGLSYSSTWRRIQGLEATGIVSVIEDTGGSPATVILSDEYKDVLLKYIKPSRGEE